MSLAEARALCEGLIDLPHEPEADVRALAAVGRWLMRFTPVVAMQPPAAIFLDLTGCERVFGGIDVLRDKIIAALRSLQVRASVAVAPTPGGAWALAASRRDTIVDQTELLKLLSSLSVGALRLEPAVSMALYKLGIETIGQLMRLPREALPARFGPTLLHRLDQALGRVPEPLHALDHPRPVKAMMRFDGAVDSIETLWAVFNALTKEITAELSRRGCGARQLHVRFDRDREPPVEHTILLSQPSRDPANLLRLARLALENIRTQSGFTAVRLNVAVLETQADEQSLLVGGRERESATEFTRLMERLRARLGDQRVEKAELVESHLPEKACRYTEAVGAAVALSLSKSSTGVKSKPVDELDRTPPSAHRPLRLLQTPTEIGVILSPSDDRDGRPVAFTYEYHVHPLARAIGPERISGLWWTGHEKTRDYFEVEDRVGECFWIFRTLPSFRWFVHGIYV